MLNEQKRTFCVFKMLAELQFASFEALLSLEETIDDPTPSWSAIPFFRLVAQKRYPSKMCNFLFFSYHTGGTCPVKECSWSRNGAFYGTERGRDAHLLQDMNANIEAEAQASAEVNVSLVGEKATGDAGSSDELMSGFGAASGDEESGIVTPGDADCFQAVLARTARKNAKSQTTPGGVITVLPPIREPTAAVNLDMIDLVALVARILHRKGATCARGGVFKFRHVVNNDTIMHAAHTCTVAFSAQS